MKDLLSLRERADAVERSVLWWDVRMNKAIEKHDDAMESGDSEAQYKTAEELKSLLRRAEMEKVEMAKIESEINQACAEAAFEGNLEGKRRRRKDG